MIAAVTGTPGTGKTTVARRLAERLGYDYVAVNDYAAADAVATEADAARDATAVDTDDLVAELEGAVEDDAVLDGHLSHHYPADVTVVLRCHPDTLRARLREKGWDAGKVAENVEAEALDVVLQRAVALRDAVYEVDTTDADVAAVVETVARLVREGDDDHAPGHVSWPLDVLEPREQ